jgi:hypothetical protein
MKWTLEVNDPDRAKTAEALALIYTQTGKLAEQGTVTSVDQLRKATDSLYGTAMRIAGKEAQWVGWKAKVDALTPVTMATAVQVWKDIALGLDDASKSVVEQPNNAVLDKIRQLYQDSMMEVSCENRGLF